MRRAVLGLAMALLLTAAPAALSAAAPAPPQVTVRLDSIPPVDVDHDGDTVVTVNGTVNVTVPSFVPVSIALNVSVPPGYWDAVVTPERGNLTGPGSIPFTVTVSIPSRVGSEDGAAVEVVANVSAYGVGRDFTGQTDLPIVQFYDVWVDPAVPNSQGATFDATAGKDTAFSFRLKNTGNGHDSFEVRVSNLADLQAQGVTADLASPVSNVAAGVTVVVTGSVHLPATLAAGDYPLSIEAASTGAASDGKEATASAQKTMHALEAPPGPEPGGGGGGGGGDGGAGNNTTQSGGFLPGAGAPEALAAVGAAAVAAAAWRRTRRP